MPHYFVKMNNGIYFNFIIEHLFQVLFNLKYGFKRSQATMCNPFNRLIAEDANTRQLRKIDNRGGRENASKMRLRVHFALQPCGVKEATNHNCRRFYVVVSIF